LSVTYTYSKLSHVVQIFWKNSPAFAITNRTLTVHRTEREKEVWIVYTFCISVLCIHDFVIKLYEWHVLWNWRSPCCYRCSIRINKYECIRNKEGCALCYYTIVIVWSISPRIVVFKFLWNASCHVTRYIQRRLFVYTTVSVSYSDFRCLHRCEQNIFLHIPSLSAVIHYHKWEFGRRSCSSRGIKIPHLSI
jgi:hypothetical protein